MQKAGPRVAVVVGDFPRLSETFIISQICGLLDAGIGVTVFADARDENGLSHPLLKAHDLMSGARFAGDHPLYRLANALPRPYRLIMAMKLLATDRTDAGLAGDFDVVLCHFGVNGLRALRANHRSKVRGQIWTAFHGYDLNAHFQNQTRARYHDLFREGDLLLPACESFKTQLIGYGALPDRIWVHRMGVDVTLIRPRRTERSNDGGVRIISVGRLV